MEQTQHYNLAKPGYEDGADIVEINSNMDAIDTAIFNTGTHTATHTRTGTVNNLSIPDGAKNITFLATADIADGDTWTVNSNPVTAVLQNGEALPGELFKSGCWVTGVRLSDDGTQLFFRAGASTVPSIFGNGSDGDAVISGTVTLPVPVPHQSIIEKHYKSLYINAGAILRAAAHNAGLIIRVQGDCIIHGTIDQSGLSPKTNPQNTYPYPAQLICGDGGRGGSGGSNSAQSNYGGTYGSGMLKRAYGGGYGGGGGGGTTATSVGSNTKPAAAGGSSAGNTIAVSSLFIGGLGARVAYSPARDATNGTYGGGAGGGADGSGSDPIPSAGGNGGDGAGANGGNGSGVYGGGAGGAGNYGGGVVLLFVGGNLTIDGSIKCNGLNGGNGGSCDSSAGARGCGGGSGGGGGGGAIYIYHKGVYANAGVLNVNGGSAGTPGEGYANSSSYRGGVGVAGGVGSITVIKHTN